MNGWYWGPKKNTIPFVYTFQRFWKRSTNFLFAFFLLPLFKKDYQAYQALVGNGISLPCNITPPTPDDGVSLILWYREDLSTPIYTVDARQVDQLQYAKHFFDAPTLGSRASFNLTYPLSYLQFTHVVAGDSGEYRCRVDFRRGRTINRVMQLNVIGKSWRGLVGTVIWSEVVLLAQHIFHAPHT